MRFIPSTLKSVFGLSLLVISVSAVASTPAISTVGLLKTDFAMKAKVTHAEAQRLALQTQPGSVVAASLKSYEGVLVWRVKVLSEGDDLHELMVDAADGHIRSDIKVVSR